MCNYFRRKWIWIIATNHHQIRSNLLVKIYKTFSCTSWSRQLARQNRCQIETKSSYLPKNMTRQTMLNMMGYCDHFSVSCHLIKILWFKMSYVSILIICSLFHSIGKDKLDDQMKIFTHFWERCELSECQTWTDPGRSHLSRAVIGPAPGIPGLWLALELDTDQTGGAAAPAVLTYCCRRDAARHTFLKMVINCPIIPICCIREINDKWDKGLIQIKLYGSYGVWHCCIVGRIL